MGRSQPPGLLFAPHAFSVALTFDRSVYDSLYVAAAIASKSHLITADKQLANALAAHPPVKWLGALH